MSLRTDRSTNPRQGRLDLPPGFEGVVLREVGCALGHARQIAAERGAGVLVWVRRFDVVEFAVVLEPDEPLARARRVLYAAMNATADALTALAPPEKPVTFAWPDTILVDGGIIGGGRLLWPADGSEDEVPDWLVAGFVLRNMIPHVRIGTADGHALDELLVRGTSLATEGFEDFDGAAVIGGFARHLLVQIDQWQAKGFGPVGEAFLARTPRPKRRAHGIDGNGDLLRRRLADMKTVERHALVAALAAPGWMDPQTQEPWL